MQIFLRDIFEDATVDLITEWSKGIAGFIDQEIKYAKEHSAEAPSEEYAKGFAAGLEQAKRLFVEEEQED